MYRNFTSNLRYLSIGINNNAIRKISTNIAEYYLGQHVSVKNPLHLFQLWLDEVFKAKKVIIPNAMCLSTATKEGAPSARIMMLRSYGKEGFCFCTYYGSGKGKQIEENPQAAITFFWIEHGRSVRIEGRVEKLDTSYTNSCFYKSQKDSQIATLCSKQSTVIPGKHIIKQKQNELSEKYKDSAVPVPPLWGGYILIPQTIEFWQGQRDKLHDRIRFRKPTPNEKIDDVLVYQGEEGWVYERLAP